MPTKTWTTQAEFEAGTLYQTVATGGTLALADGYNEGYWRSEVYQAASWASHRTFRVAGSQPTGTAINFRFRTGAAPDALSGWTEYLDSIDADGNITFDLFTYLLNHPAITAGEYIQFEINLWGE